MPLLSRGVRFLVVLVLGFGCGGTDESGHQPERGTERGRCQPDGACGEGLACWSNRCVKPPPAVAPPVIAPLTTTPPTVYTPPRPGICGTYVRTLERFARCSKLPADSATALRQSITQLRAMYAQYGAVESAQQSCQMANDATTKAMLQVGC